MISRFVLTLVLSAGAGGALAPAQEEPPPGAESATPREEAFRMVDAYLVSNLQESLGLSDDQYAKAIPLVKKLQTERREYYLARGRALRELRRLLRRGGATEAQALGLLNEIKELEQSGPQRERENRAALDGLLTPLQQAKYRVLETEVDQRMRELIRRARPGRSRTEGDARTPRR